MLLLCLKLFCDLLTPPGTVGRMGLQAKTMNYVLEMLGLSCMTEEHSVRADAHRGHSRRGN